MDDRRSPHPPTAPTRPWPGRTVTLLALAAGLATAACTVLSGPDTRTVRGILEFAGPMPETEQAVAASTDPDGPSDASEGSIEAPDTVAVGETFPVTIRTVGLDGCWSPAGEEVSVEGLTATIVPFDSTGDREGVACTAALVHLTHEVDLVFDQVGEALIRVDGRRVFDRDAAEAEPLSLEETVVVTP